MGVPGFVAWLYRNYKKTNFIFKQLFKTENIDELNDIRVDSVNHLLIDTNCLIHPKAREVYMANLHLVDTNVELLEKKIIKEVISYIEHLIDNIKPTNTIYIAIDGVAPMAKIKHQRMRRFKSVYDKKIIEDLSKKYSHEYQKEWNTSAITPGTIFMDKLTKSILTWIKTTDFNCKVIFSSSYTPGEGEHKILQFLRNSNLQKTDVSVIYGLDADLLFLSLALKRNNIYLMRETSQMEVSRNKQAEGFSYLSIDILSNVIYEVISKLINREDLNKTNIINDFVFLCYFCGNDFLPNIPSLNIKPHNNKITSGIDSIVEAYSSIICGCTTEKAEDLEDIEYLINDININKKIFLKILTYLSDIETDYYIKLYSNRRYFQQSMSHDPYEIAKHNYEENIFEKGHYHDTVRLGNSEDNLNEWKKRYYKVYFNKDIDTSNENDNSLNDIMDDYIQGLVWTTHYYYDKCKDYEWFYDHHHGPFISDLKRYIERFPERFDHFEQLYKLGVWFENQIKPLQQLMLVLPHESSYLIPASYRTLMFSSKLNKYFPDNIMKIKMDYLYKSKAWQNIPMINIIPARTIKSLTSKVILKEELERNKSYDVYVKN
jgi:5'-3' exonuclease